MAGTATNKPRARKRSDPAAAAERREWRRLKKLARQAPKGQRETTARTQRSWVHLQLAAHLGDPALAERVRRCFVIEARA